MGKKKTGKALAKVVEPALKGAVTFTKIEDDILWTMAEGRSPTMIAKTLRPGDKTGQATMRRRIYNMYKQPRMQDELAARLKLMTIMGLGPAVRALNRKAAAGRVDAIKVLFEASGFYNPRIQHDHSGEIEITIRNAPRPERVKEEYLGNHVIEAIIDAEVVS